MRILTPTVLLLCGLVPAGPLCGGEAPVPDTTPIPSYSPNTTSDDTCANRSPGSTTSGGGGTTSGPTIEDQPGQSGSSGTYSQCGPCTKQPYVYPPTTTPPTVNTTCKPEVKQEVHVSAVGIPSNHGPGGDAGTGAGCGSCGGASDAVQATAMDVSPIRGMPVFERYLRTTQNVDVYPLGDWQHAWDLPLTATWNAASGTRTISLAQPNTPMALRWTTTDLVAFTRIDDRGRIDAGGITRTGDQLIIRNADGRQYVYELPAGATAATLPTLRPTQVIERTGAVMVLSYDADGLLTAVTGPLGGLQFAYTAVGGFPVVTSVTGWDGRVTTYAYVAIWGKPTLTTVTYPDGTQDQYTWDHTQALTFPYYERPAQTVFRSQQRFTGTGRYRDVTYVLEPQMWRAILAEDASGRDLYYRVANGFQGDLLWREFIDAHGRHTRNWFDVEANLVRHEDLDSGLDEHFSWNAAKQVTGKQDNQGRSCSYTFELGSYRMTNEVHPDGSSWTRTYQPSTGQTLSMADALGRTTRWERDARGLPLTVIRPDETPSDDSDNPRVHYQWNAIGQLVRQEDELGRVTTWQYSPDGDPAHARAWDAADNQGFCVQVHQPGDAPGTTVVWQYRWDAAHQDLIAATDPSGRMTQFQYDAAHRLTQRTYADASYESWTYGAPTSPAAGLVVARRDRNGQVTTLAYDACSQLIQQTAADGTLTSITYDAHGRVATRTVRGDQETVIYDAAGRVTSRIRSPRTGVALAETMAYDADDQVVRTVDAYGRATLQQRDARQRVVRTVRELTPGAAAWSVLTSAWQTAHASLLVPVTATLGGALPASWTPQGDGSVLFSGGGLDIWGTSDSGALRTEQLVGDGVLTVRIEAQDATHAWAKVGLMVRASAADNAAFAFLAVTPGHGVVLQSRPATGAPTVWSNADDTASQAQAGVYPQWLRLTRQGTVVTAERSVDGVTWVSAGQTLVDLGTTPAAGAAYTAHTWDGSVGTARLRDLTLTRRLLTAPDDTQLALLLPSLSRADHPDLLIEDMGIDAAGQVAERIDGRGVHQTMAHNARGWMTSQTDAVGTPVAATTLFTYDAVGNRVTTTSPRGIVTAMTYTGRNLVATVTEAVGTGVEAVTRTITYSPTGKPLTETDALGRVTTYAYGTCCDRLRQIVDPAGFITAFLYDFVGNRTAVTDANSLVTTTTYDARNRVSTVTTAANETTTLVYDENLTDGIGIDAVPTVAAVLPSLGLGAGADGSAVAMTNALGETTYDLRDGLGRTSARIDALGHASTVVYDTVVAGLVETAMTDAVGHTTRARTDGAGRTRQQVDALGNVTVAAFDANGNQLRQRDALGIGWDASYDPRNRLTQRSTTRQDTVVSMSWSYDPDGNRTEEIDALGKAETSVYDARNRRITLIDRIGGVTRFGYDAVGNLTSISDADNEQAGAVAEKTTQYAYDPRHLLIAEVFPTGQQGRTLRTYGYDAGRRLTTRRVGILTGAFSAAPAFAGSATVTMTTYVYDNANRLNTRVYPADNANDVFVYDAAGRLTSASSARYASIVARQYDAAGRLTTESLTLPDDGSLVGNVLTSATWSVGYTYNPDNTLQSQTYPTGTVVARSYTPRHELAGVTLDGADVATRTFDAAGRLTQSIAGNGVVETRTYLAGDHAVATIAIPGVTNFGYSYDADGRKRTETDTVANGGGQTFGYDDAGRLITWTAGVAATQSWNLTTVGDWTSTTRDGVVEPRTNTAVHEVTQVGPNILSYDVQGNLTQDEKGTALAWDPENRLTRALVTRDASETGFGSVASYRYDALGRRIAKTVDGQTTLYLPAGAQTVVELTRPALPASQAALDGAESDGTLANQALTPASGGILAGSTVTRINFQPATTATPAGFLRDTGKTLDVRTNGLTYGWSSDATSQAVVRHGAVPLVEFDTHIEFAAGQSWSTTLPNGFYWVAVAAGDPLSIEQANHFTLNATTLTDPDPGTIGQVPAYAAGDFDGWVELVQVGNGTLTLSPATNALHAKVCWLEILPAPLDAQGQPLAVPAATAQAMATLIAKATAETGASPKPTNTEKEFAYGSYVDEVVAYTQTVGGVTKRYYPHYNHLYSVAAITAHERKPDGTVDVVERYTYEAYGKQTITAGVGSAVRAKSAVGFDRGFTGYITDNETGLLHARARQYSPTLGRFVGRDPWRIATRNETLEYRPMSGDGMPEITSSVYAGSFVPNNTDAFGLFPGCNWQECDGGAPCIKGGKMDGTCAWRPWKKGRICGCYGDEVNLRQAVAVCGCAAAVVIVGCAGPEVAVGMAAAACTRTGASLIRVILTPCPKVIP